MVSGVLEVACRMERWEVIGRGIQTRSVCDGVMGTLQSPKNQNTNFTSGFFFSSSLSPAVVS